jgi:hypothetical protein
MSERLDNLALFNHLFDAETKNLTLTEKAVAFAIAKHRNVYSFRCCPGLTLLAREASCSRRTVCRIIKKLIQKKEIVRLKITTNGGYLKSQYYFLFDIEDAIAIYQDEESVLNLHKPDDLDNFEFCLGKNWFSN